ncbi:LysR family transcriptional regulator [Marinobacter sp. ATCH36]|uniref:LysR family transcriptional regulator n=1 Tax=Marinobacter sp. ATCH36 TaxID=2945106 RepID=UPI002020CCBB|nr:LysR family transcriptional regulator [Marinobacter sp. ATCH36]MCL7945449.1 LysR family transcriptional regulator [Marinobacter sp. ATCH36]
MHLLIAKNAITMSSTEQMFLRVVESGSFKKAAEYLQVEPSSVSRKIAALEDRLQVKLLRRSTQRTTPTELGQLYYERVRQLIDDQAALEEEIKSGVSRLSGKLRIAAPADFGTKFVVPVIDQLQQEAPELSVELLLGSHFENLFESNLDVAVRICELPDSDLIAKRLGYNDRVLAASPGYLAEHGAPTSPEHLEAHNFILYSPIQARSDIEFADGSRHSHLKIKSNIMVNSVSAIRKLVLDGKGIHLGPRWVFAEDIESGRLVSLLPDKPLRSFPVHAIYPARSYLPFKVREFIRLTSQQLKPRTG